MFDRNVVRDLLTAPDDEEGYDCDFERANELTSALAEALNSAGSAQGNEAIAEFLYTYCKWE